MPPLSTFYSLKLHLQIRSAFEKVVSMTASHSSKYTHQHPVSEQIHKSTDQDKADADSILQLDNLSKKFASEQAVSEFDLTIDEGEIMTLLGPSGCGKTTTLRTIAGLERPTTGRIRLDGSTVSGPDTFVPPEKRDIGIVFQDYALFPHMTAAENIAFGIDHWESSRRQQRIDMLLELVGLPEQKESYPEELSGGQKQRIALARALAPEPEVLLLDEPFSNLDRDLRVTMREEVRQILKQTGVTAIFVTHDQEEALSISDRIAVVHNGTIEQVGCPEEVFQHPNSRFVAEFLGDAGFLSGTVEKGTVETPIADIPVSQIRGLSDAYSQTDVDVLVRPDDVIALPATEASMDGRVTYRKYLGSMIQYRVELLDGTTIECMHNHSNSVSLGDPVTIELTADHPLSWFPCD